MELAPSPAPRIGDGGKWGRQMRSIGRRVWVHLSKLPWIEILILAVAAGLRLWLIELKPPHFDEGVNGWFIDEMTRTGFYRYDPENYHGPLHFYAMFLAQNLFGRELWVLRLPAVVASILSVWALLRYRDYFPLAATRIAAAGLALSPAFVFYGRTSIHESWQVLFSIVLFHGILGLWKNGARHSLVVTTVGMTGLILTKETYLLHVGCALIAGGVLWLWQKAIPSRPPHAIPSMKWSKSDLLLCLGSAAFIIVFFYSGTFMDFSSLHGLYQTFSAWIGTGISGVGHEKPTYDLVGPLNYYWLALMGRYEWLALVGLVACCRFIAPSDARLRYLAIYAGGVLLAYSIIPYKTPWCIISIIWPFYLTAGAVFQELAARLRLPFVSFALALPLLFHSLAESLRLNFRNFTDDSEPYVYVQTYEEMRVFTGPLLALAEAEKTNYDLPGIIALNSDHPLPWVLGDFTNTVNYGDELPVPDWNAAFIVVDGSRQKEVEQNLSRPYFKRSFHLRSGQEESVAYFSADVFAGVFPDPPEIRP